MADFDEGNLRISFPDSIKVRKFDGPGHGLSHCMKAVDFIAESADNIFFIEIKDPDDPSAGPGHTAEFINKFKSGKLDEDLKYKYRDSFLYEWARGADRKPIYYYVLVASNMLASPELQTLSDRLKKQLPAKDSIPAAWKRNIAEGCAVFNLELWNKFIRDFPVKRLKA